MIATVLSVLSLITFGPSDQDRERPVAHDCGVRWVVQPIDGVATRAVWLALPFGPAHDPVEAPGLAAVLAQALHDALPPACASEPIAVLQTATATFVGRAVGAEGLDAALSSCVAMLSGDLALDDAALLRARDRAVLRADDATVVLPGPVLRGRAIRTLVDGPRAAVAIASPQRMHALDAAAMRAAFRARAGTVGAALLVLGGGQDDGDRERCERALSSVPRRDAAAADASFTRGDAPPARAPHELVEAAFVVAALRAPSRDDAAFLPFALGVEVLRVRAATTFRGYRGAESRAEFGWVDYDPVLAPPLAFVQRRGAKGDDDTVVRAEIAALLDDLATRPPSRVELEAAVRKLGSVFRAPPFDERTRTRLFAQEPAVLLDCGRSTVVGLVSGSTAPRAEELLAIEASQVAAVLEPRLRADARSWFALVPSR